jgi:tRNA threonylcarbamoyladenosine biosynthesis protein TsaE
LPDEAATRALGQRLGERLDGPLAIALSGPLGAGKTTFVHGLAAALGITGPVPSPTFVLCREYDGRLPLAHVDAYRLAAAEDAYAIGLDELLGGAGVTVVEWAERVAELMPPETLWITLAIDGDGRQARFEGPESFDLGPVLRES